MPIPIPSSLSINPMVDVRKNDLVTPPSAPSIVESLNAIDPRVALNMPMPVGDSTAGNAVRTALQNGKQFYWKFLTCLRANLIYQPSCHRLI